jgi:AraC-like DNA-binding protein
MTATICRLEGPVDFLSIGQFVSGPGWRHMRRTIDSFELIFVRNGVLPIRVGSQSMHVVAGEIALLPPAVEHAGTQIITADLEFYWLHFRVPATRTISGDELPQDDHCLILPDHHRVADYDRLAVMFGQLVDLYARFGPYPNACCDYFATSLLLEVSAQERAAAAPTMVGRRGIAGFRADGHAVRADEADGHGLAAAHGGKTDDHDDHTDRIDRTDHSGGVRRDARAGGLGPMLSVRAWIMANAYDDISVASIAERFHYSPSYLTSIYKRVFGVAVSEQIVEYRINRARELLSATASPVSDIAREVGYADPKYFMRVFKRRTGLTPGQYRDAFAHHLYNTV